jgi:hypothetical protein
MNKKLLKSIYTIDRNLDISSYLDSKSDLSEGDYVYFMTGARGGTIGIVTKITRVMYNWQSTNNIKDQPISYILVKSEDKIICHYMYASNKICKINNYVGNTRWIYTKNKKEPKVQLPIEDIYDVLEQKINKGDIILYDQRFATVKEILPNKKLKVVYFNVRPSKYPSKNRQSLIRSIDKIIKIDNDTKEYIIQAKLKY